MFYTIRSRVLSMPRRFKQGLLVLFDFAALSLALWASFCLRLDRWYVPLDLDQWAVIFSAPLVAIPVFIRMGLYRAVVRYLPERAMWTMFQAMVIATVAWVVLIFLSEMAWRGVVPRSVPVIYFGLGTFVITGSRFVAKWIFLRRSRGHGGENRPVVIYGAGDAAVHLAQSLNRSHAVIGFVDDNPGLYRRELAGLRVYPPTKLPDLVAEYGITDVILSIPALTAQRRREIVASASEYGLIIRAMPAIMDLVTGKYQVSQIREIDIIELLGRSSIPPDPALIRQMVVGRSIMVTGAGGSIGSELCRRIARWEPQRLVLFEANEFALYQIERELAGIPGTTVIPVLGSVVDPVSVAEAIAQNGVRVMFHAAAHKHVPMVEANVLEGIKNNVFGTETVVAAAYEAGVENFVLISTDKAVRPTNVMGATKRWAELIVADKAAQARASCSSQRFSVVRFGNVLGSNGSVVPLFKEQIARGGPVTLTDPRMTRYFMSIQEAAELIVQAGALSEGGDVFLLDMGEPILISELAENMVRLAGLTVRNEANPEGDIEIVAKGVRPGEKLYEELFYDSTSAERTEHAKILRAPPRSKTVDIKSSLEILRGAVSARDQASSRRVLFGLVDKSG